MQGDSFESLPVDERGIIGDRGWAVRDEVRGGIRGAKKIAGLTRLRARYVEEPTPDAPSPHVEITAPDGEQVRSDDPDANDRVSLFLGHAVTLWPLRPATDLEHYLRGAPDTDDMDAELRAIFGRTPDEPLPSFEGMPLDVLMTYESPPGTYFDAFPIHVVTDRSLATLAALTEGPDADMRRFRPNLVVSVDDDVEGDFPEQGWIGRKLHVGDVVLEVTASCPRCVVVTRQLDDLPENPQVLRTVVREAAQNVGVYANVVNPGRLEEDAQITLA
jgi:uncharacterized protein YcbX